MDKGLNACVVAYVLSQAGTSSDAEGLQTAAGVLQEVFGLSDADVAAAVPSQLQLVGADATMATRQLSSSADDLFAKFVESVTAKGYFDGAAPGSEEYALRMTKLEKKYAARKAANPEDVAKPKPANDEASAEAFKKQGNDALAAGSDAAAVKLYTSAIAAAPSGKNVHIYFANRAAAKSKMSDFAGAVEDAKASTQADPNYSKGWNRLGSALLSSGRASEAVAAFERSSDIDPGNAAAAEGIVAARKAVSGKSGASSVSSRQPASAAPGGGGMPGGMDLGAMMAAMGGGGGGGNPLAGLLNNPAMMGMAQQMMSNPQMMQQAMAMMGGMGGMGGLASMFGAGAGGAGGANVEDEEENYEDSLPALEKE
jgi:small glutamine-rich tetratricopeptide repeat-containing protein alpha